MKKFNISILIMGSIFLLSPQPAHSIDIDTSSSFLYADYSKRISMDFENAPLVDVLKIFSQQTNLNLITAESVSGMKVTVYFDNVPVEQALEQILRANNLTYEIQPGSDIYIVKPIKRPEIDLVTRVYPLKNASVPSAQINSLLDVGSADSGAGIIDVVESVMTSEGKIKEDPRTNSLIITDIATNFPKIDQTIARLDVSVAQILIEVEILDVAKSLTDKIGIDWTGIWGTLTGATKATAFPFDGSIPFIEDPGPLTYATRISTGSSDGGLLDASGLQATLRFLRTDTDTRNLARPTILTLNNQSAEIKIETDEAISVNEIQATTGGGLSTQGNDVERTQTGVSLIVTPQANLETGMITLAIKPEFSLATSDSSLGTTVKNPEQRSAQAIMKVMNGNTIVLGGLIREQETTTVRKVPILGDIPFIRKAFRHEDKSKSDRELLIFITPHILPETQPPMAKKETIKKIMREQEAPQ